MKEKSNWKSIVFFFSLILVIIFVSNLHARQRYVLDNGGFESGTKNWTIRHGYSLDNTVFHSGNTSMRTDPTNYNPNIDPTKGDARAMWISKSVRVSPGQKISASAYIKTKPAQCTDGLRIGIDFKMLDGRIIRAHNGEFVKWGSNWTLTTINDEVRLGEEKVTFWLQGKPYDCAASGWFDDIALTIE